MKRVNGVNAKFAVFLTNLVGSMWCAYVFAIIALISLPAILTAGNFVAKGTFPHWLISAGLIALIAWIAQTFLQLVLLSVIMVGQNVQAVASDARAQHTFDDTVAILNALDVRTEGGLKDVLDAVKNLTVHDAQIVQPQHRTLEDIVGDNPRKRAPKKKPAAPGK